jgi:radical SAM superfamily enzyme YgiQ (UPF0313 family)
VLDIHDNLPPDAVICEYYERRGEKMVADTFQRDLIVLVQAPGWGINTPPLGIASLSAYMRQHGFRVLPLDINIDLYNKNIERYPEGWLVDVHGFWTNQLIVDELIENNKDTLYEYIDKIILSRAKVVGFTIFVSSYLMSCYLAQELKKRSKDIIIVFGGSHASAFMAGNSIIENHAEVDFVVNGEGEETLLEIMQKVRDGGNITDCAGILYRQEGKPAKSADRKPIPKLDSLPFPDFSDFDFSLYKESFKMPIISCRSCVNRCIYCNDRPYWGSYRFRSGHSMLDEVKYQLERHPDCYFFEFYDCLVNGNVKELETFADLIIADGIKIQWSGQAIIRKEMTFKLLTKLKLSGCICLAYGLESTSPAVLENIGKTSSKGVDIDKLVKDHKRAGLGCVFNFMFGLPGETDSDAEKNIDFLERNAGDIGAVNPAPGFCLISPGTLAYEDPSKYGIDLSNGGYYWQSTDGSNTFVKRLERFERFIAATHELGIPSIYTQSKLENRNGAIANYYFTIKDYEKAIPYFIKAIESEHKNQLNIDRLRMCYNLTGIVTEVSASVLPYNCSDENWANGIARSWAAAFAVPGSAEAKRMLSPGNAARFIDGCVRRIIDLKENNGDLIVLLEGAPLEGSTVGFPNKIEILVNQKLT